MRLTVVGCSGSLPGPDSAASCYLVEAEGFRLVVPAGAVAPTAMDDADPPACAAATAVATPCTLRFVLPPEPGTTRVLVLRRGDEQVRWELVTP